MDIRGRKMESGLFGREIRRVMGGGQRRSRACALFALAALLPGNAAAFSLRSPWVASTRLGCAAKQLRVRSPASCVAMQRQRGPDNFRIRGIFVRGSLKEPRGTRPSRVRRCTYRAVCAAVGLLGQVFALALFPGPRNEHRLPRLARTSPGMK